MDMINRYGFMDEKLAPYGFDDIDFSLTLWSMAIRRRCWRRIGGVIPIGAAVGDGSGGRLSTRHQ